MYIFDPLYYQNLNIIKIYKTISKYVDYIFLAFGPWIFVLRLVTFSFRHNVLFRPYKYLFQTFVPYDRGYFCVCQIYFSTIMVILYELFTKDYLLLVTILCHYGFMLY